MGFTVLRAHIEEVMGARRLEYGFSCCKLYTKKKESTTDDIRKPLFTVSTVGMTGIAFTGGGKFDAELSPKER